MAQGEGQAQEGHAGIRLKPAELATAGFFLALGALVIYDSVKLGATWGEDGPEPGYFPFYIAVIMCLASAVNLALGLRMKPADDATFVEGGQLKLVLSVLVPSTVYVAAIGWLGIYVASALFIAFFMRWLGKYPWWKLALVSVGTSVVFFLIFEMWFKVPLPKGPLETVLGLN